MISRAALLLVLSSAAMGAQGSTPPAPPSPVYFDYQVDKPVTASPKNKGAVYPKELRVANVEGQVMVKFVVDDNGRAVLTTIQVIRSDNELFTKAVRDMMPTLRFTPAEIKGKKVAQFVQMPFQFSLAASDTSSHLGR